MSRLKHSITLYGFGNRYVRGLCTFEDTMEKAKKMGGDGIEIVAPQMVPGHPNPSDEWVDYFKDCCQKYELTPVCYSIYIDNGKHKGHYLSEAERMSDTIAGMEFAKRTGCSIVRSQDPLLPSTMEKLLPYAQELDVHLAIEMHGPYTPSTPIFQEYAELFEKTNDPHLGVVMDFSSFASGAPSNCLAVFPDDICNKKLLYKINNLYATTEIPEKDLIDMIYEEGGDDADVYVAKKRIFSIDASTARMGTPYWRTKPDFEGFRSLLKYSRYMHGKFYHMEDDLTCPGMDFPSFIKIMKEENYTGFIASEYEGDRYDNTVSDEEQIRLHIQMLDQLWDNA
ncbi:MAG: sugar phosphate isomerase/epimerase [Lachnospiraceae bacterium]|nr:sugar phosphate isomerase/epimerase [Lachnospiraceae bacterium]